MAAIQTLPVFLRGAQLNALSLFCFKWFIARSIRLMTPLSFTCSVLLLLSSAHQHRWIWTWEWYEREEKTKKRNPSATPPLLSVLSFLSSHSLPSNHLALKHDSSVYRCLRSLCPPLPPLLLLSSTVLSLTLSCLCTSCIIEERSRRRERGRREGEGGREKILVMREHTRLSPLMGGNVQCTDGECVQSKSLQSFLPQIHQSLFIKLPFLRVLHL